MIVNVQTTPKEIKMSKCAFFDCKNQHQGSKQFNDIVERIYLCADCLIRVAHLDSFNHGMEFIRMLKESKEKK